MPQAHRAADSSSTLQLNPEGYHAESLALQQELAEVTNELEKRESDHSWTLEQLARGQMEEKARLVDQLRYFSIFLQLPALLILIAVQAKPCPLTNQPQIRTHAGF